VTTKTFPEICIRGFLSSGGRWRRRCQQC